MNEDKVTLRDIYRAVERVEDKMDRRFESVEKEIDGLQAFQNKTLGIATVFAGVISLATTYVWNKVTGQN